jgi:hypothetical protein
VDSGGDKQDTFAVERLEFKYIMGTCGQVGAARSLAGVDLGVVAVLPQLISRRKYGSMTDLSRHWQVA